MALTIKSSCTHQCKLGLHHVGNQHPSSHLHELELLFGDGLGNGLGLERDLRQQHDGQSMGTQTCGRHGHTSSCTQEQSSCRPGQASRCEHNTHLDWCQPSHGPCQPRRPPTDTASSPTHLMLSKMHSIIQLRGASGQPLLHSLLSRIHCIQIQGASRELLNRARASTTKTMGLCIPPQNTAAVHTAASTVPSEQQTRASMVWEEIR